jgi:uncharacterized RDD family membrane protein YckC
VRTVGGNCPARPAAPAAVAVLLALLALAGAAPAAQPEVRLLAQGARERYWVARVYDDAQRGGPLSDVYARPAADGDWRPIARVEGRAVDLADRGDQLALLLDNGGWLLVSDETVATGRAPPPGVRLLALASRGDTLLAAARVTAAAPATSPSTSTSHLSQDADRLALYALSPQGWSEIGPLDVAGPLPATSGDVSLAVVEGDAVTAVREGPGTVTVRRQGTGPVEVATAKSLASFRLLGGGPVPVLWTVESDGATRLHWLTQAGVRTAGVDAPGPAAAAHAIDRVRVISGPGLILQERLFDPLSGEARGAAAKLRLPRTPVVSPLFQWFHPVLTALFLFTIVASVRRRREMLETMQAAHQLPLAPYGRRLLAGAIDAAPLLGSLGLLYYWEKQAEAAGGDYMGVRSQIALLSGVVVYLLHTSVSEIAFGRTLGKAACGLRVVGLDGRRATPGAMLTRNLLRLIDLSVIMLVLVFYSPLRQRAGDVAAGTLVVLDKPGPEDATALEEPTEASAKEKVPETADR